MDRIKSYGDLAKEENFQRWCSIQENQAVARTKLRNRYNYLRRTRAESLGVFVAGYHASVEAAANPTSPPRTRDPAASSMPSTTSGGGEGSDAAAAPSNQTSNTASSSSSAEATSATTATATASRTMSSQGHSSRPAGYPDIREEELDFSNMNNMPGVWTKQYDDFQASINGVSVICSVVQLSILMHCFNDFKQCKGVLALEGHAFDVDVPLLPEGLTDSDTIQKRLRAKAKETIAKAERKGAGHLVPGIKLKTRLMDDRFCPSLEAFNNEVNDLPFTTKTVRFKLPNSVEFGVNNKYFNGNTKDATYLEKEIMVVKGKGGWPWYFASFFAVVKGSERIVKEKKQAAVEVDLEDATAGLESMSV